MDQGFGRPGMFIWRDVGMSMNNLEFLCEGSEIIQNTMDYIFQAFKGTYYYAFGDYGGLIVAVRQMYPTGEI